MATWKAHFTKGVASYRANALDDAIASFAEALKLGGDAGTILDTRAAVYQKQGKLKEALRDSKAVIDAQPNRWQGYARSARLFFQVRKYDAASRMVDLALQRVPKDQTRKREELAKLQEDIQLVLADIARRTTYYFGRLPIELATAVFSMVLEADRARVVVLASVCKDWRNMILRTPAFWNTLVVSGRRPANKIKMWRERSKGRLTELALLIDAEQVTPAVQEQLAMTRVTTLRTLRLDGFPGEKLLQVMPAMKPSVIRALETIHTSTSSTHTPLAWLDGVPDLSLRDFSYTGSTPPSPSFADNIQHLKSLAIGLLSGVLWPDLLWVLHQNPRLEHLKLSTTSRGQEDPASVEGRDVPAVIQLPLLESLHFERVYDLPNTILPRLAFPSLRTVAFDDIGGNLAAALQALVDGPAAHLTSLTISRARVDVRLLLDVLAHAAALETLVLTSMYVNPAGAVLDFLATASDTGVRCPRLRHLDCSRNPDVKAGPLVRIVKSRLAPEGAEDATATPAVQQLEVLRMDECPAIDAETLPWFRSRVPVVSCVYMTKKSAGWKR